MTEYYAGLDRILAEAEKVLDNPRTEQSEVDEMTQKVRDAINALQPLATNAGADVEHVVHGGAQGGVCGLGEGF